ncbi:Ribosomal protein S24e [uncultured archaeon]|nr:Ribosomal protein S24e [uncultured archaeon]
MDNIKNIKNNTLKRQELVFKIESEKGPSFSDMRKKISEEFSKPEENIDVFKVKGSFGKNTFEVHANIYDSKETYDKAIELKKTQKQRETEKKALVEAAKSAAEAKKKAEDEKKASETPAA